MILLTLSQKTYFDEKLKSINKKVTSNKTRHLKTAKKLKDLPPKIFENIRKSIWFLLDRMYFTGDDSYPFFF